MKTFLIIAATMLMAGCTEVDKNHPWLSYLLAVGGIVLGFVVGGFGGMEEV